MKKIISVLLIHGILSSALWGMLYVYQKGYNTLHHDPVQMASVTLHETQAEIRIFHQNWFFQIPKENRLFSESVYLLTDLPEHSWLCILDFMKNS